MSHTITGATHIQKRIFDAFTNRKSAELDQLTLSVSVKGYRHSSVEGFEVSAQRDGNRVEATIGLTLEHSLRYALNALLSWISSGDAKPLHLIDGPHFPIRGVVEGFYGQPWSHAQRLRAIEHFGDFNMNTYFIAPKDDPLQRFNWRSPFGEIFIAQAKELSEHAHSHGIDFVACVSPGLSVRYSDQSDVDAIVYRFKQLLAIGITHFGLLWDDISWELQHPEDIAAFTTTAQAQATFTNKIWDAITHEYDRAQLTVCPMQYSGRGTEEYLKDLGRELKSRINIMWTGRSIISEYLDISDAVIFDRTALRPALYWDNYPVNDGSLQSSLFIGPVRSREKGLHKYSSGLLSNPMVQFEASILPLATIGDYLWNTETYDPENSWERALISLFPHTDERASLRAFFRTSMGSPVGGDPAPDLRKVFNAGVTAWRSGDMNKASEIFHTAGDEILAHHTKLTSVDFSHRALIEEISPWLDKFKVGGQVLKGLGDLILKCHFDQEKRAIIGVSESQSEIAALKALIQSERKNLFGDQIEGPLNELAAELRTYS
jgi:hyaluronoglucosaminidase